MWARQCERLNSDNSNQIDWVYHFPLKIPLHHGGYGYSKNSIINIKIFVLFYENKLNKSGGLFKTLSRVQWNTLVQPQLAIIPGTQIAVSVMICHFNYYPKQRRIFSPDYSKKSPKLEGIIHIRNDGIKPTLLNIDISRA